MIDSLIKNKMKLIKNILIGIFLFSAVYVLAFSSDIFEDRLITVGLSLLMGFLSIGMAYSVLWVQVKNPVCSKKVLNFFCNFSIYFSLVTLLMFLISLIFYREADVFIGISAAEGVIFGAFSIKRKYIIAE